MGAVAASYVGSATDRGGSDVTTSGLSSAEATRRLAEFGPNEIRRETVTSSLALVARQFASPVIWLLVGASLLSAALSELLDATAPESAIAKFVEKRGPGLHHLALRVEDIDAALAYLSARGVRLIDTVAGRHVDRTPDELLPTAGQPLWRRGQSPRVEDGGTMDGRSVRQAHARRRQMLGPPRHDHCAACPDGAIQRFAFDGRIGLRQVPAMARKA